MREYRSILITALILMGVTTAACNAVPPPAPEPEPEPESGGIADATDDRQAVVEAHQSLLQAYEAGDVEAFTKMLDPSAGLLVFHPSIRGRFEGTDEVRREMGKMFAEIRGADWSDHHAVVTVKGDVGWVTAQILIESPSLDPPFIGRGTEIFVRRPEGWKLTHGHWSAVPEDWSTPAVQAQE